MKRIMLALTAALILAAMTVVAVPAMAQGTKEETKMEEKSKEKEKDKDKEEEKDKMKEDEKKDLPESGGMSVDAALLGLAAGTLLVGGGLVVRRVIRQG